MELLRQSQKQPKMNFKSILTKKAPKTIDIPNIHHEDIGVHQFYPTIKSPQQSKLNIDISNLVIDSSLFQSRNLS